MSPDSRTGATVRCGSTAELGTGPVRPTVSPSMSGPRSHSETNSVADVERAVTSSSTRPLPITATGSLTGSVVKVADWPGSTPSV